MRLPPIKLSKLPFIKWNRKIIYTGIVAIFLLLLVVGVATCQKHTSLTDDEEVALQFFKTVYVEPDVQEAQQMVASESREDPFVKAGIKVGAEFARENPINSEPVQIETVDEKHTGNVIVLYHPEKTVILLVKEKKIRGFEEMEIAWDALQDQLNHEYPNTDQDWKEATIH